MWGKKGEGMGGGMWREGRRRVGGGDSKVEEEEDLRGNERREVGEGE